MTNINISYQFKMAGTRVPLRAGTSIANNIYIDGCVIKYLYFLGYVMFIEMFQNQKQISINRSTRKVILFLIICM